MANDLMDMYNRRPQKQSGTGGPGGMGMVLATRNIMLLILRWTSTLLKRDDKSVAWLQSLASWLQKHAGLKRK